MYKHSDEYLPKVQITRHRTNLFQCRYHCRDKRLAFFLKLVIYLESGTSSPVDTCDFFVVHFFFKLKNYNLYLDKNAIRTSGRVEN